MEDPPRPRRNRAGLEVVTVSVDTVHEILVNKLAALLSRVELRDLEDVEALLASGANLDRALSDVPVKDGGFSPLTLAWVLKDFPVANLARAAGLQLDQSERLERVKESLIQRLLSRGAPGASDLG